MWLIVFIKRKKKIMGESAGEVAMIGTFVTIGLIVLGIVMFMVLVVIHEFGHFFAAKKSWVHVHEFGIGIPPKILTLFTDKAWTKYTLNLIPLWWFVRLKWEDPSVPEDFHASNSFIKAKIRQKIIILLWWIIMNLVFAWLLFVIVFSVGYKPVTIIPDNMLPPSYQPSYLMPSLGELVDQWFLWDDFIPTEARVVAVSPWFLAEEYGIITGDLISRVNNVSVNQITLMQELRQSIGGDAVLTIERGQEEFTQTITCTNRHCMLGAQVWDMLPINDVAMKFWVLSSFVVATQEIGIQSYNAFSTLWWLFGSLFSFNRTEVKETVDTLAWPVGAIKVWGDFLRLWWFVAFVAFAALISLALAIFNLLPIPALDGGRLLGVLIQRIFRLNEEKYFVVESYINFVFFVLLMWLGVYIIFKDLAMFWWVRVLGF